MEFINHKEDQEFFRSKLNNNYDKNQVFIIGAKQGIGKTAFVKEITKSLSIPKISISTTMDSDSNQVAFRRLIQEIDRASEKLGIKSFKNFSVKKNGIKKTGEYFTKIFTTYVGQIIKQKSSLSFDPGLFDIEFQKMDTEILNTNSADLLTYAQKVLKHKKICFVIRNSEKLSASSIHYLNQLIHELSGCVFFFEYTHEDNDSSYLKENLKYNERGILIDFELNKLSPEHIKQFILNLLHENKISENQINWDNLKDILIDGNLSEASSMVVNYAKNINTNMEYKVFSTGEILSQLSDNTIFLLYLVSLSNNKLSIEEITSIMNLSEMPIGDDNFHFLIEKKLMEISELEVCFLPSFVEKALQKLTSKLILKNASYSSLNRYLRKKLNQEFNANYVDILVKLYIKYDDIDSLMIILSHVEERILLFNTQIDRTEYFKQFFIINFKDKQSSTFINRILKIAYDANLYEQALSVLRYIDTPDLKIIWLESLLLNRCEMFKKSEEILQLYLPTFNKNSQDFFDFSLVHMMNLIQLGYQKEAESVFNTIHNNDCKYKGFTNYTYYLRLSNYFYSDFILKVDAVKQATHLSKGAGDKEFYGLNNIYLCYLYTKANDFLEAETSLNEARLSLGNDSIYTHMILQNQVTLKFHKKEIDKEILKYLEQAKFTAYDNYDKLAIHNNILVYYLSTEKVSNPKCYESVEILEELLSKTEFVRFRDDIYYNLFFYYKEIFDTKHMKEYYEKLPIEVQKPEMKFAISHLIYETSWKIPLTLFS